MALLFADSCDHYSDSQVLRKWDSRNGFTINASAGRNSTAGLRGANTNSSNVAKAIPSNPATLIVGHALFASALPAGNSILQQWAESGAVHIEIQLRSDGKFDAFRGAGSTLLGTSSAGISAGQYNYLEIKITINDSTGVVTMKLNNVQILNLTSQDTRNGGTGVITNWSQGEFLSSTAANHVLDHDDYYMCDTTGGTNNDFLGDVRVQAIFPTGAGNYTQWTPSTGSNFQNVDDNPPNDDTDYNSESTANDKDSFAFGDVTPTTGTVYAVCVNMHARKDDAGTRTIRSLARLSATDAFGSNINVGTTYANYQSIHETKPGGGAFSITDVNNSEFGYELVA